VRVVVAYASKNGSTAEVVRPGGDRVPVARIEAAEAAV
jgi:hypothetical protein